MSICEGYIGRGEKRERNNLHIVMCPIGQIYDFYQKGGVSGRRSGVKLITYVKITESGDSKVPERQYLLFDYVILKF